MASDPPRGSGLRPLPLLPLDADAEETEPFYETPTIAETTEERVDTTEILRPSSNDTTEILERDPAPLPPRVPQLPPPVEAPTRPRGRSAPSRVVPVVGIVLATTIGLALFALLVLLVAFGTRA